MGPLNGYIDACKCTEIFRNNLYSRVSKGRALETIFIQEFLKVQNQTD